MKTISFCIDVNSKCNLQCSYCYLGEKQGDEIDLSTAFTQIYSLIQSASDMDTTYAIKLTSAEPLLSFALIKEALLKTPLAKHPQVRWYLATTGLLMTEEISSFFAEYRFEYYFTLHGNEEIHNKYRGEYTKTKGQILKYAQLNPFRVAINFMVSADMLAQDFYKDILELTSNPIISCVIISKVFSEQWSEVDFENYEIQIKKLIFNSTAEEFEKTRLYLNEDNRIISVHTDGEFYISDTATVLYQVNKDEALLKYHTLPVGNDRDVKKLQDIARLIKVNEELRRFFLAADLPDEEYDKMSAILQPNNLIINITDDCNLGCEYCFAANHPRTIDLGTLKSSILYTIREQEKRGVHFQISANFFGGEPMLGYDSLIVPFIDWLDKEGYREKYTMGFGMTTNGTLFTEERLRWLRKKEVNILLSIDGDRATQERQRPCRNGESSFDKIEPMIPLLLELYPETTFRSTVIPKSAKDLGDNYLFARKKGFLNFYTIPNMFEVWSEQSSQDLLVGITNICNTIYWDVSNYQRPCEYSEFSTALGSCWNQLIPHQPNPYEFYKRCGIGTSSIGIAANGDLIGCQEHATYIEKDIFYLGDIWKGVDRLRHKRLLLAMKELPHPVCREAPERCDNCSYIRHCAQRFCPSHNMPVNSLVKNPLIHCKWKDMIYQLAQLSILEAMKTGNQEFLNYSRQKGETQRCGC